MVRTKALERSQGGGGAWASMFRKMPLTVEPEYGAALGDSRMNRR